MNQESRINSDGQEQVSYSNTKIQLVVGKHIVDTERAYTTYRRRINDIGVHFFRRGFNNFLFVEDGSGNLESRIQAVNDSAKKFHSYRTAYWHIIQALNDADAMKATQLFDQNPVERFISMGRKGGFGNLPSQQQAWVYGTFAALDSIRYKGFDVQLAAEGKSQARKQLIELGGEDVFSWRETARLSQEADKELAMQIENLISQYPERTRLLGVFGITHVPIRESFPISLQQVCEVVQVYPDEPKLGHAVLLHDIQKGKLTDEEIEQRLKLLHH